MPIFFLGNEKVYTLPPSVLRYEFNVENEFENEQTEDVEDGLNVELEAFNKVSENYRPSDFLWRLIKLNKKMEKVLRANKKDFFEKVKKESIIELRQVVAYLIKYSGRFYDSRYDTYCIKAKTATLRNNYKTFLVPDRQLGKFLRQKRFARQVIVVENETAFVWEEMDERETEELLKLFELENCSIRKVDEKTIVEKTSRYGQKNDSLLGAAVRHPIIGYVGYGPMKGFRTEFIGIPKDIADKLDSDDDGDDAFAIPCIIVKNERLFTEKTVRVASTNVDLFVKK